MERGFVWSGAGFTERGLVRLRTTSTKSETQIGARGFVAVEVMWQLGVWLILGFFHWPRPCLVALYQCRKACQIDA